MTGFVVLIFYCIVIDIEISLGTPPAGGQDDVKDYGFLASTLLLKKMLKN